MTETNEAPDAVVIERTLAASTEQVWRMWADQDQFAQWYGPEGMSVPVAEMDVVVGGRRRICMASGDGAMKMWFVGTFTEIVPGERLVYTESMADEDGNVLSPAAMGMPDGHPETTEITVVLKDLGDGRTHMTMTHAGVPADSPGATGWNMAFDKLVRHLATLV